VNAGTGGLQMHRFSTENYEEVFKEYEDAIKKRMGWLAVGKADVQRSCLSILEFSVWNACILLILGRDEAEALRYFRQAVEFGLKSLGAEGSTKGMRVYDALFEHSEDGVRPVYIHEKPPSREPRLLSVEDFGGVLTFAVAFGDRGQMETVARYPEARYRNPDEIVGEDFFGYLRGIKAFLLGDETTAKRDVEATISASNAVTREHKRAFLCLLERDMTGFRKHVEKRLQGHKKQYEKKPHSPEGFICQPLLMLSRLAIDLGLEVEEQPYVPIHLLPNYGSTTKARLH
jgi:Immunity protein 49